MSRQQSQQSLRSQLPPQNPFSPMAVHQIGQIQIGNDQVLRKFLEAKSRGDNALPGVFKYCLLLSQYLKQPEIAVQEKIVHLFSTNFESPELESERIWEREPLAVLPMTKIAGLIKKNYSRKCKVTDKGFIQIDEKNKEKPFAVKKVGKPEEFPGKNDKMEWTKEGKEYPWRVILTDTNDDLKAIYAKTQYEAVEIRDFAFLLSKKLKTAGINALAQKFLDKVYQPTIANEFMACMQGFNKRKSFIDQSMRNSGMNDFQPNNLPPYPQPPIPLVQSTIITSPQPYGSNSQLQNSPQIPSHISPQQSPTKIPQQIEKIEAKRRAIGISLYNFDINILNGLIGGWMRKSNNKKTNKIQVINGSEMMPAEKFGLVFKRLQFIQKKDLFIKPLVFLEVVKNDRALFEGRFDTIIQKKSPCICYKLLPEGGPSLAEFTDNINTCSLKFKILDRISGVEVSNDLVRLKVRDRNISSLFVLSEDGQIRIELGYISRENRVITDQLISSEGLILNIEPLSRASEDIIKKFWNEEAIKKDYYSPDLQLDIFEILNKIQPVPKYWWMGLTEDQYQVLSILEAASKILNFTVIEAHLPIIRALLKMYENQERAVELAAKTTLSLLTQYLYHYFLKSGLNKIHQLHHFIGLDTDCSFASRLTFQISVLNRMLQEQHPRLMHKLAKKNIHISLLLFQYIFQIFSKNFNIRVLVSIWNEIFKDKSLIQQKLLLICIVLVGLHAQELKKVNIQSELRTIFQSPKKKMEDNKIIGQLENLNKKYFTKPEGIISSIANRLFSQQYFEQTVNKFYLNQTQRLKQNAQKKIPQKNEVMNQLTDKVPFKVPEYPPRKYTFHLYFSKFPNLEGIVFIKAGADEFECFNKDTRQYFVLENVTQPVQISYVYRGKKWASLVQMVQGVHFATLRLVSSVDFVVEQDIVIEYVCGLLTEAQENMIKKNKPNEHFISSYMKLQNLIVQCYKPPTECMFLRQNSTLPFDLLQGIRVLFTAGGNKFNDIDFYLSWIQNLKLPIFDKVEQIRNLSNTLCLEQYHYKFPQAFKILLRQLLARMNFPITDEQYQFYFNAQAPEFNCPRIIKCRFINHADGRIVKLTTQSHKYLSAKGARQLESDIVLTGKGFFAAITAKILETVAEPVGMLIITYSSEGEVLRKQVPVVLNKDTRELQINPKSNYLKANGVKIKPLDPEVLSVQTYPAFSKITKMFESGVENFGTQSQRSLRSNRQYPKQHFNLLHLLQSKFSPVIPLRSKPSHLSPKIPLLSYFCQLTTSLTYPPLPRLLFQGQQWNPKRICTYRGELQISDNRQGENFPVDKRIGIHANISRWDLKTPTVYFWKVGEEKLERREWKVYVYYGMGVERWEKVVVRGYCIGMTGQKYYIVVLHGEEKLVMPEDLDLGGEDPFGEVDITRDDHILRQLKKIEGKSEAEKTQELADKRKFTSFLQHRQ